MGCCQERVHRCLELVNGDKAPDLIRSFASSLEGRLSEFFFPIRQQVLVHSSKGQIEETYKLGDIIGSGSFSSVRTATHLETSIDRAVKIIAKNVLTEDQTQNLVNEVDALKSFDHPNIIRIIEVVEDNYKLNIVTELCQGGELFDRIFKNRPFTENIAARYMYQLFSGLIHIHEKGFIHGDLKPENILLLTEEGESLLKIIDFGISKQCIGKCKLTRFIGTVIFK